MAVLTSADKCFKIDGVLMSFNSRDVTPLSNGVRFTNRSTGQSVDVPVSGTTLNGVPATNVQSILTFVEQYFFSLGGGSGDGAVESVTGSLVSGSSSNPIIDNPLLESHQVIITDGGTRSLTDFNGTLFLVTNGVDPAISASFNWNGLDDNTRKLTIVFTFDLPTISHTAGSGVTTRRLPTSAKIGDVWTVVYDKFYDTWDLASNNQVGTDRQVQGYVGGETKPVIIGVPHLTDIGGFPSFSNGVLTATSMNADTQTALLSFIEFSTSTPKVGTFVTYTTGGRIAVNDAVADGEAVSLGQLNTKIPAGGTATTFLRGDGTWVTPANTTYTAIAEAEATTGTATTVRGLSAVSLKRDVLNRTKKNDGVTEVNSSITLSKVHADKNKPIVCTGGTPLVFTIPIAATGLWEVGDEITIWNNHGATLTINSDSVSLNSVDDMKIVSEKGWCKLLYITTNQWQLVGSLTVSP